MAEERGDAPWRKYRYPTEAARDYNDADKLREMLDCLKVTDETTTINPSVFGGIMSDLENEGITFERSASCVPLDIPKNTRILAFLAIGKDKAAPSEDGWLLSDFMAFYHLDYRLTVMSKADQYVELLALQKPMESWCQEFDTERYASAHGKELLWRNINANFYEVHGSTLFPKPYIGRSFYKGSDYVIAAVHSTISAGRKDVKQCFEALDQLKARIDKEIADTKEAIKDIPDVRSKRQRVAKAFGMTLRSLSPVTGSRMAIRPGQSGQNIRLTSGPRILPRTSEETS
ncbi:hypothetical protein DL98DRAFT_600531 [Cadophora sp. DSE1049]|nr:hypothetical protein DL98DRAFT_600531 [Cadophora sp. DSE1049]